MAYVKWFEQLSRSSLAEAGGKGANLGEMANNGFPIPPGFVVVSSAYFDHLSNNGLTGPITDILSSLDVNDSDNLNRASEQIKSLILGGEIPSEIEKEIRSQYKKLSERSGKECYVAVRSSATAEDLPTASFAGQQSTFLNIRGSDNVVEAVKECWASLFEPRAIFYRVQNNFEHMKVGLAAVVQLMVQSERAGVMFTVDPVSQDADTITIEGAYGLGETVVSGQVTPDTYRVSKSRMEISDKTVAKQTWMLVKIGEKNQHADIKEDAQQSQKLTDSQILDLAKIGKKIEEHYNFPQDIEWAVHEGNLYIVQSRPITTLRKEQTPAVSTVESRKNTPTGAKPILRGLAASPGIGVGKVKVCATAKEIGKMSKGDILVAPMTTPDFVPAMKKAGGIVTDQGGMTSHAAIVSRELGIPCIVGTGSATTVLRDEMLVSVDGERGIVYEGEIAAKPKAEAGAPGYAKCEPPITGTKIYVNLA
ncbi:MAG: PEP/pyruvate-binding domain-containing protein, partial [Candidatus Micrarchaeia archaeon]